MVNFMLQIWISEMFVFLDLKCNKWDYNINMDIITTVWGFIPSVIDLAFNRNIFFFCKVLFEAFITKNSQFSSTFIYQNEI